MFGPDRCGSTSKVHFIFRHKNPITGEVEEKHLQSPPSPKITKTSALYTLIVRSVSLASFLSDAVERGSCAWSQDRIPSHRPATWTSSDRPFDQTR